MPTLRFIDAHCHLDFEAFDDDRPQVLQRAAANNINDIIIPGTQRIFWDRVRMLCESHKQLHACYGLHPYWVTSNNEQDLQQLESYIHQHRPVAIGECGLDFRPLQADKKLQMKFFKRQLNIAEAFQLPVVIHSVKATETVIETIKKFKNLTGMVHSYSGSAEQARQLVDLNFFISAGGSITYDGAVKIKQTIKEIPSTSLLIETDAPDQADKEHHDKRNEPAFMINTARVIAALREVSLEEVARQTTENARTLFGI
jgi:TatD DNase family protein